MRAVLRDRRARWALGLLFLSWIGWRAFRLSCGSPDGALSDDAWTRATRVLARDGRLLGERPSTAGLRGRPTRLDEVSPRLVAATLASEDHGFYAHDGVDRTAIVRALVSNVAHGRLVSGGSTITQQLVKRLDHQGRPRPRTLREKVVEAARAQNLEASVDKRTILEAYLTRLDYGRGLAGPEAAAKGYFGVHAADLSLAQAALLAVLPRAPSALDPYRHRDRAVSRQRALLERMHASALVSREDLDRALTEPLVLRERTAPGLLAPHVVLGAAARASSGAATEREVTTTLDFDLQRDVEALVRTHAGRLRERGASTAAVVVVDVATGDVLAEVGSVDFADRSISGAVDVARARRQPGSTLKPFVYARAFEGGVSPMEMLADVPTELGAGSATYAPSNFDGTFEGPVSAREALGGSLNVPVVRLARDLGAAEVVSLLRAAGLSLPEGASRYGLSIALGSGEVTPLELANAYATLARGGERAPLRQRASDPAMVAERVLDAAAVAAVADALSDPFARVRGLRTRGPFELPFPTALKTGTSTGYRDAWTAGFTRERVVVVWAGNADGAPTKKLTGAVGAGPLFTDVMSRAMRDVPLRAPLWPADLLDGAEVCPLSGLRPGPACGDRVRRRFPKGRAPTSACHVHVRASARAAPGGEPPFRCDESGRERIVVLPGAFDRWLSERPPGARGSDPEGLPWFSASRVPGCQAAAHASEPPRIVLLSPRDGSELSVSSGPRRVGLDAVDVQVETFGLPRAAMLEVVVDGRVALALDAPYRGRLPVVPGDHLVEVRPVDGRIAALLGRAAIRVR